MLYEAPMTTNKFGDAYRTGYERTVRFLLSRGAQLDTAQEASQEAWVRGWERLDQLQDEGMLSTWINTIALNLHRRLSRKATLREELGDTHSTCSMNAGLADLEKVLQFSDPEDRALFRFQIEGFTTDEIAKRYGVSENAIRIRLMRARRKTAAHIEKRARTLRAMA